MLAAQLEARKQRGYEIATSSRIDRTKDGWKVPSQSGEGSYLVVSNGFEARCDCPDCQTRRTKCKHMWAVELVVTGQVDAAGTVSITTVRKTYSQDWHSYDLASINQKPQFLRLLHDVTKGIPEPEYTFGRPGNPVSDRVFGSVLKVFSTFSLRRFMGDMQEAHEKGYISKNPCYASVGHFMQKEEITPILRDLVTITSTPLKSVEKDFAIDSTGFGTSNFQRWYSFKHGRTINSKRWVKAHFMCGVKTNIISSVKVTSEFDNDCPEFKELTQKTGEIFDMEEISADKAYLSQENFGTSNDLGATLYVPFKSNNKPTGNGMIWKKMYHYFMMHNEEFLEHYHKRSNVETTVQMIKSKFGDKVRSKTWTAQVNEVLCKIICHNICCVIQEMYELGVEPDFWLNNDSTRD